MFGKDTNNNYGYIIPGADTVTPFKSESDIDSAYASMKTVSTIGTGTSFTLVNNGFYMISISGNSKSSDGCFEPTIPSNINILFSQQAHAYLNQNSWYWYIMYLYIGIAISTSTSFRAKIGTITNGTLYRLGEN